MVWVGRDLKAHLMPLPAMNADHVAPSLVQPGQFQYFTSNISQIVIM